ncbi:MAG: LTA synthase family protein [Bacteroidota bacterium]
MKFPSPDSFRHRLVLFVLPVFLVVVDFFIRSQYLLAQSAKERALFLASAVYEWMFYFVCAFGFSFLQKTRSAIMLLYALFLSCVFILVYGHFFYFGTLPNNFSLNFVIDHSSNAYALISASIRWYHPVIVVVLAIGIYTVFRKSVSIVELMSKKITYTIVALFIGTSLVLNNNLRFHPDSYSFTPYTLFAIKYVIQERYFGSSFEIRRGYVKRLFSINSRTKIQPKFNCLFLIGESVRGLNLPYNGYRRQTFPFVDSLIAAKRVLPFKNHIANCVSTQYALPMIFSGCYTLDKLPLAYIYDYVHEWTTAKTFFISSQSMVRSNIHLVYETLLDTFICQERTPLEQFNDMGVNDQDIVPIVDSFLQQLKGKKFFGIVQFNNTHFPYRVSDKQYEMFTPAPPLSLNAYDNALLEHDEVIRRYFSLLRKHHLLDSTIVIYVSDHGEAFEEHYHSGHLQFLYQADIATPLWIYFPPGFPQEQQRVAETNTSVVTSHLDLFPTILDIFEINDRSALSLIPVGTSLFNTISRKRAIPIIGMDMIETKGIVYDTIKYIETMLQQKKKQEVYDLKNNPAETVNLWSTLSAELKKYFEQKLCEFERLRQTVSNTTVPSSTGRNVEK